MKECSWKNLGQMKKMRGSAKERLLRALQITYTELITAGCSVYELSDQFFLIFDGWKFLKKLHGKDWWVAISPSPEEEILGVKIDDEPLSWQLQHFHPTFLIGNQGGQLVKFSSEPICTYWICSKVYE